jgi:hypothetical protein
MTRKLSQRRGVPELRSAPAILLPIRASPGCPIPRRSLLVRSYGGWRTWVPVQRVRIQTERRPMKLPSGSVSVPAIVLPGSVALICEQEKPHNRENDSPTHSHSLFRHHCRYGCSPGARISNSTHTMPLRASVLAKQQLLEVCSRLGFICLLYCVLDVWLSSSSGLQCDSVCWQACWAEQAYCQRRGVAGCTTLRAPPPNDKSAQATFRRLQRHRPYSSFFDVSGNPVPAKKP